jgi:aspartyl-tRNA(Asn)/glutamyl-tRNA(Gln) amidotransferase subunit A
LTESDIRAIKELLCRRELTVVDHVESTLAAMEKVDRELGAFVSTAGEDVLVEAAVIDDRIRDLGVDAWRRQPLLGVTVSVKDLIQTRDLPTARGSLLENRRPRVDAPAVARLRAAGAIVVGKTSTSEYGWSASTVNRLHAPTRNPWAHERSAGGSSGGAAASVSAGLCTAALGTDGAGSIRIPAAFCGVVGFKPSFGHIPYVPVCADRLAHLGPIARSVGDIIELMAVLRGPHPDDPDSGIGPIDTRGELSASRIAWLEVPGTEPDVRAVCERIRPVFTDQGHQVDCIDVPFADPYPALLDILAATEAAGTTSEDEELCDQGRLAVVRYGRTVDGATVMRAEDVRMTLRATLRSVMDRYDILAMPTVPIEPFEFDAIGPPWAAEPADLQWLSWSPTSYPFNITGQPAISVPIGLTAGGLPVGIQLVGRFGADDALLKFARQVESDLGAVLKPNNRETQK